MQRTFKRRFTPVGARTTYKRKGTFKRQAKFAAVRQAGGNPVGPQALSSPKLLGAWSGKSIYQTNQLVNMQLVIGTGGASSGYIVGTGLVDTIISQSATTPILAAIQFAF